ncbi:MAG TPA: hypothetical protein VJ400_02690, partial [Thermoplasmata archaeon]|nr:hypothetical protein [Thermoplasmata archaeon]
MREPSWAVTGSRTTPRNVAYSARSYAILIPPPSRKGAATHSAYAAPPRLGLTDCPRLRAIVVKLAAAVRSSGGTTLIVYDCRVGTSIWERDMRARYAPSASGSEGMSGT